jgi:hypothetical protein
MNKKAKIFIKQFSIHKSENHCKKTNTTQILTKHQQNNQK